MFLKRDLKLKFKLKCCKIFTRKVYFDPSSAFSRFILKRVHKVYPFMGTRRTFHGTSCNVCISFHRGCTCPLHEEALTFNTLSPPFKRSNGHTICRDCLTYWHVVRKRGNPERYWFHRPKLTNAIYDVCFEFWVQRERKVTDMVTNYIINDLAEIVMEYFCSDMSYCSNEVGDF